MGYSEVTNVREQVYAILCHPADVRNVAGAVRAVVNAGLAGIRVATKFNFDEQDLQCYSSGAMSFTDVAFYPTVHEAIADCPRVIGTSRRLRDPDAPPEWPAAGLAKRLAEPTRTALLFGCERTGLTRSELALCSAVVHIPTTDLFPSMNLAHAVACMSYELARPDAALVGPESMESAPKLSAAARDAFYSRITDICSSISYPPGRSTDAFVRRLRKILHRANLNQSELSMLGGLFREMERLGQLSGTTLAASEPENDDRNEGSDTHQDHQ